MIVSEFILFANLPGGAAGYSGRGGGVPVTEKNVFKGECARRTAARLVARAFKTSPIPTGQTTADLTGVLHRPLGDVAQVPGNGDQFGEEFDII